MLIATGGLVHLDSARLYLLGCPPAAMAIALVAFARRASHGLRPRAAIQLPLSAGLMWPLLAIATVEVVGMLTVSKVLEPVRSRDSRVLDVADTPLPTSVEPAAVS